MKEDLLSPLEVLKRTQSFGSGAAVHIERSVIALPRKTQPPSPSTTYRESLGAMLIVEAPTLTEGASQKRRAFE